MKKCKHVRRIIINFKSNVGWLQRIWLSFRKMSYFATNQRNVLDVIHVGRSVNGGKVFVCHYSYDQWGLCNWSFSVENWSFCNWHLTFKWFCKNDLIHCKSITCAARSILIDYHCVLSVFRFYSKYFCVYVYLNFVTNSSI